MYSRADNARSLNDIELTLPAEPEAREAAVDEALLERASRFLASHTLEVSMPEEGSRSLEEGKKKLRFYKGKKDGKTLLKYVF